jgi:hypothetical protein
MVDYPHKCFHIRSSVYHVDFLILNQSRAGLERDIKTVLRELRRFGWRVSEEKCSLHPSPQMQYLGVVFDTVSVLKCLPADKVQLNCNLVSSALSRRLWSLRSCQNVTRYLNFAADIVPRGRLHLRYMQCCLLSYIYSPPLCKRCGRGCNKNDKAKLIGYLTFTTDLDSSFALSPALST